MFGVGRGGGRSSQASLIFRISWDFYCWTKQESGMTLTALLCADVMPLTSECCRRAGGHSRRQQGRMRKSSARKREERET